jgi:CheY-like chemotaxis protein
MEKQGVPDESQSRYLSLASKGSDALMKLINELLDYQRFGQTDIQLYPEPIALKSGITSSYESMRPLFANSGVDFVLELKVPEDLVVKLDNNRLTQVLNNLVGNAKKFTASGCVVLRLEVADINHKTAELSFSVTDTGSGMDEATLARLGEAFFQAEEGYRKSHQGTGLGLGIVKRILAGFGAQLSVESALGEGSEFSFRFNVPIVESSELVAEATEVQSLGAGRGIASSVPGSSVPEKHQVQAANSEALQGQLSVLYVEDSEINQAVMEALCEQLPVALEVVDAAKTGYQRISQTRYDVIITDIQMPEFSGVDFLQWFKEDPALNDGVPFYACTANATQEALAGFAREGFSGVLTKPVSLATLEDFFREQLADVEAVKAS